MKPPVVVLGATGQVGLFAVARLLEGGRRVIAVTRHSVDTNGTGIEGLSRLGPQQLAERLNRHEAGSGPCALLSCGPVALARMLLEDIPGKGGHSWERAAVIGTTSIRSKRASAEAEERRLIAEIESELAAIRQGCAAAGIPLTVLHPTLIYGCGLDQNLSRVYGWIQRHGFAPLARDTSGLRQPLHVADLADTLHTALEAEPAPVLDSAVCGGSTLAYGEMIGLLFDAAGRRRRMLRLPRAAFGLAAALASLAPGAEGINREMFRRQSADLVFDDRPAREALGHAPREFRPTGSDFECSGRIERIRKALQ